MVTTTVDLNTGKRRVTSAAAIRAVTTTVRPECAERFAKEVRKERILFPTGGCEPVRSCHKTLSKIEVFHSLFSSSYNSNK